MSGRFTGEPGKADDVADGKYTPARGETQPQNPKIPKKLLGGGGKELQADPTEHEVADTP